MNAPKTQYNGYMNYNFTTPHRLKIRLNPRYFFALFMQKNNADINNTCCSIDDMINDEHMYSCVSMIEVMFQIPAALIFFFTMVSCFVRINAYQFFLIAILLYILGSVWRFIKQDIIISAVFTFLATIYNHIGVIPYVILAITFLATKNLNIFIWFVAVKILCAIFSLIINRLIASYTCKKFGFPFNDTEICAFRVFHHMLVRDDSLNDFIREYLRSEINIIKEKPLTEQNQ